MKKSMFGIVVLVVLMFVLYRVFYPVTSPTRGAKEVESLITSAGGVSEVTMACRQMLDKLRPRPDEFAHLVSKRENMLIPKNIRLMNADYIEIERNRVMITFPGKSGNRLGLLVFFDGAKEYGTVKITNNL